MMPNNLSRQKIFEVAIASFLNEKREKEAQKKQGSKPEKYNKPQWLENTAKILSKTKVQIGTHLPKATHSDVKGGTIYVKNLPERQEIGTHLLPLEEILPDSSGNGAENAAVLEGWQFLHLPISVAGEKRLLKDWLQAGHEDAFTALSEVSGKGKTLACSLLSFIEREEKRAQQGETDGNAKQIYWLNQGGNPKNDKDFILLQPLYPTSLAQVIYETVQKARWGGSDEESRENLKAGREARRKGEYWEGILQEFLNMAKRSLGGTKPQNVSQLNSLRRGRMELFSCAPPSWQGSGRRPSLKGKRTLMQWIMFRPSIQEDLKALVKFLKKNPNPDMHTRNKRDRFLKWIAGDVVAAVEALRPLLPAGWSADPECRIPEYEMLWLDTTRVEEKDRFSSPEDEAFRLKYDAGTWADEVAAAMVNEIITYLVKAQLPANSVDRDFILREVGSLIVDVAWPQPMRRRPPGKNQEKPEGETL